MSTYVPDGWKKPTPQKETLTMGKKTTTFKTSTKKKAPTKANSTKVIGDTFKRFENDGNIKRLEINVVAGESTHVVIERFEKVQKSLKDIDPSKDKK